MNNSAILRVANLFCKLCQDTSDLDVPDVHETAGLCGPASLRSVLLYFGKDISEAELAKIAKTTEAGTSPENMVNAAKELGFEAIYKTKAATEEIKKYLDQDIPVIVDWFSGSEGHYSVVESVENDKIILMDPELGSKRILDVDAFMRIWFDFAGPTEKHKNLIERPIIVIYPKNDKKY